MKDLLVYTADADAMAFMRSLLKRPQALGIRDLVFESERHPQRDCGMVQSAAELVRMKKGQYDKVLLMWDHHGSGREHRQPAHEVAAEVQNKLDTYTWRNNSAVMVLIPELEQWLWFCEQAVANHYGISPNTLQDWIKLRSDQVESPADELRRDKPKELFEFIVREKIKRTISPRDFEGIGAKISVPALERCQTFSFITGTLRKWFAR